LKKLLAQRKATNTGMPSLPTFNLRARHRSESKWLVTRFTLRARSGRIGGVSATNIAKWDGTNWSALGTGLGTGDGDTVSALAIWGDNLYVGGYFTNAGSQLMRKCCSVGRHKLGSSG